MAENIKLDDNIAAMVQEKRSNLPESLGRLVAAIKAASTARAPQTSTMVNGARFAFTHAPRRGMPA
jgi:hypothetical protein